MLCWLLSGIDNFLPTPPFTDDDYFHNACFVLFLRIQLLMACITAVNSTCKMFAQQFVITDNMQNP